MRKRNVKEDNREESKIAEKEEGKYAGAMSASCIRGCSGVQFLRLAEDANMTARINGCRVLAYGAPMDLLEHAASNYSTLASLAQ